MNGAHGRIVVKQFKPESIQLNLFLFQQDLHIFWQFLCLEGATAFQSQHQSHGNLFPVDTLRFQKRPRQPNEFPRKRNPTTYLAAE